MGARHGRAAAGQRTESDVQAAGRRCRNGYGCGCGCGRIETAGHRPVEAAGSSARETTGSRRIETTGSSALETTRSRRVEATGNRGVEAGGTVETAGRGGVVPVAVSVVGIATAT